jgi:predicted O-linked N-acetylglucosamine transferase (SPINDLY family)
VLCKITAEALDAWMSLLAEVPHSKLMLMPFDPNWSSNFPRVAFSESIDRACRRHGIARERVVVIEGLACRADVKAVQRLADLYLDVFPFSGSLSVIDPLELWAPRGSVCRRNFPR